LIATLILPLVALFFVTIFFYPRFFIFLILGLLTIIAYLIPLQNSLSQKKAEVDLLSQDLLERVNMNQLALEKEEIAIRSFEDKIVSFSELKGLTERLGLCLSLDETSRILSEEVNRIFGGNDTVIILYLFQSRTGELGITSSHKGKMEVNIKQKKGDIFDRWVVKTLQPLLIEDVKSDYRFDADKIAEEETRSIRSLISVPLLVGHKAIGILRVDSAQENNFTVEDLRFLNAVGDLGAVAIENAQLYERVEQLAIRDGLTNLYLRRYLMDRLPEEISRHVRSKSEMSFLMMDLDFFKDYNDKYGHMAGDIVLKMMSASLTDFFSEPGNLIFRYGGEEFCVLLADCSKQKAEQLANEFRQRIAKERILLRRQETNITVSIGVASFPHDAQGKDDLIHKADLALYQAKKKGRDRVCVAV
ncbi:sensor domain-containing diguanylate cyclase, partial [Candidatus Nomurabacteria bacterium]|nr:sensor domain-containing diguanylate cyclase [Candidatus Nomurabacteria bacterium]